jgi:hypothetical protein
MARVAPSERFRRELDEVLAGVDGEVDPVERIVRLGARLILQDALEDEVTECLGRARYERAIEPVSHATATSHGPWSRPRGRSSWSARACATPSTWASRGTS